ncbi:Protein phosphatase 1 regulatory subunit 29 [Trichoplax sp. H2]|nr:Protein phosphatase 1 regulatory subunit 29 [Trichoplax sp. H2]|eukprot:RDD40169.1 Protein phosphatase 1 regulatory subunit 29 [Trichoplax sp. H2]
MNALTLTGICITITSPKSMIDSSLPFGPSLKCKKLQFNRLQFLPSHVCTGTQIKFFNAGHNLIQSINRKQFRECKILQELDLSANRISELPTNVFMDLIALERM